MRNPPATRPELLESIQELRSTIESAVERANDPDLRRQLPEWLRKLEEFTRKAHEEPGLTISLIGGTGAGKTTLINAILGSSLLPTREGAPCTASLCQISHSADGRYHCDIHFLRRDEWQAEVERLKDLLRRASAGGDESEADREVSKSMVKGALQKLRAVYPSAESKDPEWFASATLTESEEVRKALDAGQISLSCDPSQLADFERNVEYGLSAHQPVWPIVREVHIRGPFEALRGGLKLIDLPGINDPNEAREEVLRRYLKNCQFVWLVFGIVRGMTKDLVQLMETDDFFRQLILDGRTDRLTFIGTRADNINFEEACKQYQLPEDATDNEVLAARKAEFRDAVSSTLTELVEGLARDAGEEAERVQKLIDRVRKFSLFTVSAQDYLIITSKKRRRTQSKLETPEQTELPAVLEHLDSLRRAHGYHTLAAAIHQQMLALALEVRRELQEMHLRAEQQGKLTHQQQTEVRTAATAAEAFLADRLDGHLASYRDALGRSRDQLMQQFQKAAKRSGDEVTRTVTKWADLHVHTLSAICRNRGRFSSAQRKHDLPADLTRPLLNSIAISWDDFFSDRVAGILSTHYGSLGAASRELAQAIMASVSQCLKDQSRLKSDVDQLLQVTSSLVAQQMAISRGSAVEQLDHSRGTLYARIPEQVRAALGPTFEKASAESGKGTRQRIIEDHLRPAARRVATDVFRAALREIDAELTHLIEALTEDYREVIATLRRHANSYAKNLWHEAAEASLESIEAQKQSLHAALQILCKALPDNPAA